MENPKRTKSSKKYKNNKKIVEFTKEKKRQKGHRKQDKLKKGLKILGAVGGVSLFAMGLARVQEVEQRNEFLESLKLEENSVSQQQEKKQEKDVMERIQESYKKANPEKQRNKEDFGILGGANIGNGNVYMTHNEEGDQIYIYDSSKGLDDDQYDINWIEGEDINKVLAVIDKIDNEIIFGILDLKGGEKSQIEIQEMIASDQVTKYEKAENQLHVKNVEKLYNLLNEEWQKRSQAQLSQKEPEQLEERY